MNKALHFRQPGTLLLATTILLVAANLRPTITSFGPVLEQVGQDRHLDTVTLGLLGAVPMLCFAIVSPIVQRLSRKIGAERAVFFALLILTAGTIMRSLPGTNAFLWVGTILLASAIAVGNVLLPAIVKRDFPNHVSTMTSLYSATLSGLAALGAAVAFPLSQHWGWDFSLGVWAACSVLAAGLWITNLKRKPQPVPGAAAPAPASTTRAVWKSMTAWQVAVFMGLQSLTYFLFITWLPSYEVSQGISATDAGLHLFLYQVVGIFGGLAAGPLLNVGRDQRFAATLLSSLMVAAGFGLIVAPNLLLVWLVCGGVSSGACLVVSLTMIALRARTPQEAATLSGMAQGVGYLIAAAGPWGAAWLYDMTASWNAVFLAVALLASIQLVTGLFAGRNISIQDIAISSVRR